MDSMNARVLRKLESALELDEDQVREFYAAIRRVDGDVGLTDALRRCREEHAAHLRELLAAVQRYGARPARRGGVVDGLMDRVHRLRSATGVLGALKALEDREERVREAYAALLAESDLPAEIANVVRKCRDDERRHVESIRDAVDDRRAPRVAPGAH